MLTLHLQQRLLICLFTVKVHQRKCINNLSVEKSPWVRFRVSEVETQARKLVLQLKEKL